MVRDEHFPAGRLSVMAIKIGKHQKFAMPASEDNRLFADFLWRVEVYFVGETQKPDKQRTDEWQKNQS